MIYILDCNSAGIANIITVIKNILNVVWIITPILAILYLAVNFTKIAKNPEDKKIPKNIKNIILALIITFLVPTIVNAFMYIAGDKTDISSCWKNTTSFEATSSYIEPISNLPKNHLSNNRDDYEKGKERKEENNPNNNNNSNNNYTGTGSTSLNNLFAAAKKADNHTYTRGYVYWNAISWDGTDMWDERGRKAVSCDRGVALILYFAGITNKAPHTLALNELKNELVSLGWKQITSYDSLAPGDVVFYGDSGGNLQHTFMIGERIDLRYDWGMDDRIMHKNGFSGGMPFQEGISREKFIYAYRMP